MMADWTCPACTVRNADTKLRCMTCMRARPRPRPAATGSGASARRAASRPAAAGHSAKRASNAVIDLTSPHRGSAATTNGTSGRTPSTESARSRKRRREREERDAAAAASSSSSGAHRTASSLAITNATSSSNASAAAPAALAATLQDNGFSFKSGKKRKAESTARIGNGARKESAAKLSSSLSIDSNNDNDPIDILDDNGGDNSGTLFQSGKNGLSTVVSKSGGNDPPTDAAGKKKAGVSSSSSGSKQKAKLSVRPTENRGGQQQQQPVARERTGKKEKITEKHQSTLFGKFVDDIRKKDPSSLPTTSRTYDKNVANDRVEESSESSASTGITRNEQTSLPKQRTSSSNNVFVEGRFQSLKAKSEKVMRETFGIESLRNLQPRAVDGALRGQSQIVVMATGVGKSLCYQLPAAVLPGITVVISPLIALMVDQVQALNSRGIPAALYSSANGQRENAEVLQSLVGRSKTTITSSSGSSKKRSGSNEQHKPLKLVYCTPELIETDRFRAVLTDLHKRKQLALFAIDEAHCLSTWGHDFRPAYRKLSWLSQAFCDVPLTACTATATPKVIKDIRQCLNLPEKKVPCHQGSFNRSNILYEVRYKDNIDSTNPRGSMGDLIGFIRQEHEQAKANGSPCSGIVYVHKRADTSMIAQRITRESGVKAAPYHAGLKDTERSSVQKQWTAGTISVAVATVAFGMGIDLAHVRYVLHWSMAKTVEGFYQESGRAGRDGLPAKSVLYYSKDDSGKFAFLLKKNLEKKASKKKTAQSKGEEDHSLQALQKMVDYCITPSCRRKFLLQHFGEKIDPRQVCNMTCDFCRNPTKTERAIQNSQISRDVSNMLQRSQAGRGGRSLKRQQEWDGQWTRPHADSDDKDIGSDDDWEGDQDLGITRSGDVLKPPSASAAAAKSLGGFVKASSILDKYEQMEVNAGGNGSGGFVSFRAKDSSVKIPEHLRRNAPDPLQSFYNKPKAKKSNEGSKAIQSKIVQMEAELQREKEELEARKARLLGKK